MKAVLDHVGIAVSELPAALAFYRDVLGLHVEESEDVVSQQVRAHFIPTGGTKLEVLEATAPSSAIARFVEKRGPGLHHIALRVDDIVAALALVKSRGARLIDERPRPGAEGALVAFIHPSSAHGVLVELKQRAAHPGGDAPAQWPAVSSLRVERHAVGDFELTTLHDGYFRLDGGAMFGVVPRVLWEKKTQPDARHRILLAMRPLLIRGGGKTMLVDAGVGDKESEKFRDIYGIDRGRHLDHALADAGVTVEQIDVVIATHLHFDHAGGFTRRQADGSLVPRFPRARYVVAKGEWDAAVNASDRTRASYLAQNFGPLLDADVVDFVNGTETVVPGVRLQRSGGHTANHQMVWIESQGKSAVYPADIMPTSAHLADAWVMGFDLYPLESIAAKHALAREVLERQTLVLFGHDPVHAAGYLTDKDGARSLSSQS